jgi:hypothetical protein
MSEDAEREHFEPESKPRPLAVEPLPFTQVRTDNGDELLRQWIFKEVHGFDVALNKATIDYCESAYQWIRYGRPVVVKLVK